MGGWQPLVIVVLSKWWVGVGIYGFCLFKKKRWVEADVSININMYGLWVCVAEWDGSVDVALGHTNMRHLTVLREKEFQKKKALIPFSLLLPMLRAG